MFILYRLEDTIPLPPANFGYELKSIKRSLMLKYANKLLPDVGLCVCLHDILELGDAYLFHGDGSPWARVVFRFVVFRPALGEILCGTVLSSDAEGLRVSLGFFDELLVPASHFRADSLFDPEAGLWRWKWGDYDLWFAQGERIMVRVSQLVFADAGKGSKVVRAPLAASLRAQVEKNELIDPEAKMLVEKEKEEQAASTQAGASEPNFRIIARVDEDGLGMVAWW